MSPQLAEAAAFLAAHWPVFPCLENKRPATRHGFRDAVADPAEARRLFATEGAALIGVPTGEQSGLAVVDLDVKNGAPGLEWFAANEYRLPRTRRHRTRSGGRHLLFRYPTGRHVRNSAGRIATGVDIRGEGGYVIFPPSAGYEVEDDAMPAEMPAWLLDLIDPPKPPAPPPVERRPPADGDGTRYGLAALQRECAAIVGAPDGAKHDTLNRAAYSIGGLVAAGELLEGPAFAALADALGGIRHRCEDYGAAERTLRTAFQDGMAAPRQPPPPPRESRPMVHVSVVMPPDPVPRHSPPEHLLCEPGPTPAPAAAAAEDAAPAPVSFPATPFDPAALATLAPRRWVYGHFLISRFVSVLGAPGGVGKTAYGIGVALSVALGRPLLEEPVHDPGPVWLYNLEDPQDELLRRVFAACLAHRVEPAELAGRLFLDSGRDRPLVVAERAPDGTIIALPVVDALVAELRERGIRLLNVDPFVKSHRLEENRNEQVDFAATLWSRVADQADCSILLTHHFRKGGTSGEADAFRGASALVDASRAAVSLAAMTEKEAGTFGVDPGRRRFFIRADNAKLNLAPPPDAAVWLEMRSIDLPNGDRVQAVARWHPPSPWDGMPAQIVSAILERLAAAPADNLYQMDPRGTAWAGEVIIDLAHKTAEQAAKILKTWLNNGVLEQVEFKNSERKKRTGLVVNAGKAAELRAAAAGGSGDAD